MTLRTSRATVGRLGDVSMAPEGCLGQGPPPSTPPRVTPGSPPGHPRVTRRSAGEVCRPQDFPLKLLSLGLSLSIYWSTTGLLWPWLVMQRPYPLNPPVSGFQHIRSASEFHSCSVSWRTFVAHVPTRSTPGGSADMCLILVALTSF